MNDIRKIIQFLKHTDIQYISTTSKLSQSAVKLTIINSSICSQRVVQSRTTDHGNTENGKNSFLLYTDDRCAISTLTIIRTRIRLL